MKPKPILASDHIPCKRYLGDGVYAEATGYGATITLTTEVGGETIHRIVLEANTAIALDGFASDLARGLKSLLAAREAANASD